MLRSIKQLIQTLPNKHQDTLKPLFNSALRAGAAGDQNKSIVELLDGVSDQITVFSQTAESKIKEKQREIDQLRNEIKQNKAKQESTNIDINNLKQQYESEKNELEGKLKTVNLTCERKIQQVNSENNKLKTKNSSLQTNISELNNNHKQQNGIINKLNSENEELKTIQKKLQIKTQTLENNNEQQIEKTNKLVNQVKQLKSNLDACKKEAMEHIHKINNQNKTLTTKNKNLQQQLQSLQTNASSKINQIKQKLNTETQKLEKTNQFLFGGLKTVLQTTLGKQNIISKLIQDVKKGDLRDLTNKYKSMIGNLKASTNICKQLKDFMIGYFTLIKDETTVNKIKQIKDIISFQTEFSKLLDKMKHSITNLNKNIESCKQNLFKCNESVKNQLKEFNIKVNKFKKTQKQTITQTITQHIHNVLEHVMAIWTFSTEAAENQNTHDMLGDGSNRVKTLQQQNESLLLDVNKKIINYKSKLQSDKILNYFVNTNKIGVIMLYSCFCKALIHIIRLIVENVNKYKPDYFNKFKKYNLLSIKPPVGQEQTLNVSRIIELSQSLSTVFVGKSEMDKILVFN